MVLVALRLLAMGGEFEPVRKQNPFFRSDNPRVYDRTGAYLWMAKSPPFEERPGIVLDGRGLPLNRYSSGVFYNPTSISQFGLRHYSRWLSRRRPEDRAKALRAADWLLKEQTGDGRWFYQFPYTVGMLGASGGVTLAAPWTSAMAQGQGMSLLVRTWRITGDENHLRAARRAVLPLLTDVRRGGLRRGLAGGTFLEEYPTTPPSYVLNGFMFTLIGLWDLSPWSSDAAELYTESRRTLVRALPLYDRGPGQLSAYHLGYRTAGQPVHTSPGYHEVHRAQLRALNGIDQDTRLKAFLRRWGGA